MKNKVDQQEKEIFSQTSLSRSFSWPKKWGRKVVSHEDIESDSPIPKKGKNPNLKKVHERQNLHLVELKCTKVVKDIHKGSHVDDLFSSTIQIFDMIHELWDMRPNVDLKFGKKVVPQGEEMMVLIFDMKYMRY